MDKTRVFLFFLLVNGGCGVTAELHDMHKNLNETNQSIGSTSVAIGQQYLDLRASQARDSRQNALTAMNAATDMGAKLSYAAQYFAAFEFQVWKPMLESNTARLAVMSDGVKEFLQVIREYISSRTYVSPASMDNNMQNLYALSALLHFVGPSQIKNLQQFGVPTVSMLDMLEAGLKAKKGVTQGTIKPEELPDYQAQVLILEQDAVYMLRVRQNFLKAFAFIQAASDSYGDQPTQRELTKLYLSNVYLHRSWIPNFGKDETGRYKRNVLQIEFNAGTLEYAAETHDFLKAQGYDPMSDHKIWVFLTHLSLESFQIDQLLASPDSEERLRGKALKRFSKALDSIIGDES